MEESSNLKIILRALKNNKCLTYDENIIKYVPSTGSIYCFKNEIFNYYGKDLYKCGTAKNPDIRMKQFITSFPSKSEIKLKSPVFFDKFFAETLLFYLLNNYRFKSDREFINCDLNIITETFDNIDLFFTKYNTKTLLVNYLLNLPDPFIYYNVSKNTAIIPKNIEIETTLVINTNCTQLTSAMPNNYDLVDEYLKDTDKNKTLNNKYHQLRCNLLFFNLNNDEIILKYKSILNDKNEQEHYFNFLKLFNYKLNNTIFKNVFFNTQNITKIDEKIKVIKKLYSDHKLTYLSLDKFQTVTIINITDDDFLYIKKLFRSEKKKPTDSTGLKYLIVGTLKNLIGKLKIIETIEYKDKNRRKQYKFTINTEKKLLYQTLYESMLKTRIC
jgi:hypothetical protein